MKPQFQHKLATSYFLWFENFFFKKSEAYSVETGKLTYYADDRLPSGYNSFGTSFKQIIYDKSLPNTFVPSGLYVNSTFVPFGTGNNIFDFENGRLISNTIATGANITGSFTPKQINIYYTNDTEENVVINVQEKINQSVSNIHTDYYKPYEQKIPAIYISNETMKNNPFALGGMNETITKSKAIVIANNSYELDCVLSIFGDSYNEMIALVDFDSHPLNEYGGLKSGYSYDQLSKNYGKEIFVKDVIVSKMSDKLKQNLLKDLYIGFIDFDLSTFRYRN